jgi:hypothetical protein
VPSGRHVDLELVQIATPGGGSRVITVLGPVAATIYADAVEPIRRRRPLGGPLGWADVDGGEGLRLARSAWRAALARLPIEAGRVVRSDVRACYASIGDDAVATGLAATGANADEIARFLHVLGTVRTAGVPGLPAGPGPSAIVADAVLSVADRAVREAGGRIVRWVDDVWIAGEDRRGAIRAFDAWTRGLAGVGLAPHEGKTCFSDPGTIGRGLLDPSGVAPSRVG